MTLLERSKRGVCLTSAGEQVLPFLRKVLNDHAELEGADLPDERDRDGRRPHRDVRQRGDPLAAEYLLRTVAGLSRHRV